MRSLEVFCVDPLPCQRDRAAVMGKTVAQARAVGGNANAALWGLPNDLPISRCLPTFVIPGRQHRLFNEVPVVVSD